jgi:2-polyprenyl-6-methoxyphenol hydroxylase-like FAD-dependent oxidoreductase
VTAVDERGRRRSELGAATYETVAGSVISLLRGDLAGVLRAPVCSTIRFGTTVAAFSAHDAGLSERIGEWYQMLTTPNRMIGCYAVGEGGFVSFFLYRDENWQLPDDPVAELRERFGDLGWVVPELLHALSGDVYFDQAAQIEMESWHRDRKVLVGDACGAASLFAGHGASLAMTGAYVLAEEPADSDVDAALARYQGPHAAVGHTHPGVRSQAHRVDGALGEVAHHRA